MRRDSIVAYVHRLQQTKSEKLDAEIVPKTASFFKVSKKTVWNALAAHRPNESVDLGVITFTRRSTSEIVKLFAKLFADVI